MAYSYPIYNNTFGEKDAVAQNKETGAFNGPISQLSGPNWMRGDSSNKITSTQYYDLDLCNKYHTKSKLKQFQMVTFYFQSTSKKSENITEGTNATPVFIRAQLPDKLTYSIGGEWGAPFKLGSNDIFNALMSTTNTSNSFGIDSTKIWTNPKPLALKLSIPIFDDADSDSHTNFQEALEVFSRAVLPEINEQSIYTSTPGPNFSTALANRQDGVHTMGSNLLGKSGKAIEQSVINKFMETQSKDLDRITIQIGGMLLIDWAIITDVQVTYPNIKNQILHNWIGKKTERKIQLLPQIANLDIQIETVTGLTRTAYRNMLQLTTAEKEVNNSKASISNNFSISDIYKDETTLGLNGLVNMGDFNNKNGLHF